MKTAIYIVDGSIQLVLTPESDFEKKSLAAFTDKDVQAQIKQGSFYRCQGGYFRQSDGQDQSLFLIADCSPADKE